MVRPSPALGKYKVKQVKQSQAALSISSLEEEQAGNHHAYTIEYQPFLHGEREEVVRSISRASR